MSNEQSQFDFDGGSKKQLSHRDDPATSKLAVSELTANGTRANHAAIVLRVVEATPGQTACEIAKECGLDEYQVRRRLTDLKNHKKVVRRDSRTCQVKGTQMVTWEAIKQ